MTLPRRFAQRTPETMKGTNEMRKLIGAAVAAICAVHEAELFGEENARS